MSPGGPGAMGSVLQRPCLLCKPRKAERGRPGCNRPLLGFALSRWTPPRFCSGEERFRGDFARTSPPGLWMQPAIIFRLPVTSQRSGL